jgi:antitoxin component of RelBE/YafQ-DinJ toxin-antitoxin module
MKKKHINLTVDEATVARLAALGERYGATRSAMVRMLVARYSRRIEAMPPVDDLEREAQR